MAAPAPLVDANIDLRDFPYYQLEITRLFGSDFNALSDAETWCAGVKLWFKSFHQVPAGSISSNDVAIAKLAEVDAAKWKRIKKGALRGWVKCSDGRYYHPVVAEKAIEGWIEKLASGKSSAAGNAKRYGHKFEPSEWDEQIERAKKQLARLNPGSRVLSKRHSKYQTLPSSRPSPDGSPGDLFDDSSRPPDGSPDGSPDGLPSGSQEKRNGNGKEGNRYLSPERAQGALDEREKAFERFEAEYPPDGLSRPDAAKRALNARIDEGADIDEIVEGAKRYAALCKAHGRKGQFVTAAQTWLADGGWKQAKRRTEPISAKDSFIAVEDDRWGPLSERFLRERGRQPPRHEGGWRFPNEWIQEIRECVP